MEFVTLNNGIKMPLEGFGVFQIPNANECKKSVLSALKAGYRLIDTAAAYMNEEAVGEAIRESGIPREDLFITSKIWVQDFKYEDAKKAIQSSLDKLGLDYIDLYLVHQPFSDYYSAYRAMEEAYKDGKIKAIGVCNFYPERLADFCLNVDVIPAVNQVECHPFFQQKEAMNIANEFGVRLEAWGPFAEGGHGIFTNPLLTKIGEKYKKTAAQVILRWNVQRGVVVIPKSVHEERIIENFNIWDFVLSTDDMNEIEQLDLGHSEIIDHYCAPTAKMLNGFKIHA